VEHSRQWTKGPGIGPGLASSHGFQGTVRVLRIAARMAWVVTSVLLGIPACGRVAIVELPTPSEPLAGEDLGRLGGLDVPAVVGDYKGRITPTFVTLTRKCDEAVLETCRTEAASEYGRCFLRCSPWCSSVEINSQRCRSVGCCLCFDGADCRAVRDDALRRCDALFGCPDGFACTSDVRDTKRSVCCPSGTGNCRGQCLVTTCASPAIFDSQLCRCRCPTTSCPSGFTLDSSCRCVCPPTTCADGKTPSPTTCLCECAPGHTDACDGICRNLNTDTRHCGTCGRACGLGEGCCNGTCTPLTTNTDCGVCGRACSPGQGCCNRVCIPLNTSLNCGACGKTCTNGKRCQNGTCACPLGQTECNGACKNLSIDSQNCGQCGRKCPTGATCQNSICVCPSGKTDCRSLSMKVRHSPYEFSVATPAEFVPTA